MLSSEKRPVRTIETDENGLPRWVMARWQSMEADRTEPEPERVLLLAMDIYCEPEKPMALIWRASDRDHARAVNARILHEIPPPETATAQRLPSDGLLMVNVLELPD